MTTRQFDLIINGLFLFVLTAFFLSPTAWPQDAKEVFAGDGNASHAADSAGNHQEGDCFLVANKDFYKIVNGREQSVTSLSDAQHDPKCHTDKLDLTEAKRAYDEKAKRFFEEGYEYRQSTCGTCPPGSG